MAYGFGSDYGFDPATVRRTLASYRAPRPSWDVPEDGTGLATAQAPAQASGGQAGAYAGGGTYASTGDPMLDTIRNTTMADAQARARGGRAAAMRAAPNDPSLAAYAGLEGLLSGQGDAAMALNRGATNRLLQMDERQWQEYIMRLQRQWAEEDARRQAWSDLLGGVGDIGGIALGAAL